MTTISDEIKTTFFELLQGDKSLADFEKWVYAYNDLENILGADKYYDLISFSYKQATAKNELTKIITTIVDMGEYETWKLRQLLVKSLTINNETPHAIMRFYDLYCNGYTFLSILGLNYGLYLVVPPSSYSADTWENLRQEEKEKLLNSFYPDINTETNRILDWLEKKKIVLTGKINEVGQYQFTDNRTQEERLLTA